MHRVELLNKLELVGRALASNNLIPIFECFCFTGTHVYANNDSIAIKAPCVTDAPFAVNGHTLLGLLRASQSAEVSFQLGDEHEVLITAGKSKFKLPYYTEDEFLFKEPEERWGLELNCSGGPPLTGDFLYGMEACLQTSSKDAATQPAFVGVWLKGGILYSCDGDALSRYTTVLPKSEQSENYMMPNAFCETILKIAKEQESVGTRYDFSQEWAMAIMSYGFVVYGRLIVSNDPLDHEKLIADSLKGQCVPTPIPKGLIHALERAKVVALPESKPTQLTVADGKLHLLTDTSLGVVRDVLPFQHPDVVALVSAELMQRAVSLTTEMAIMENVCTFRNDTGLWRLLSNYG